jgi:hypothetical protein
MKLVPIVFAIVIICSVIPAGAVFYSVDLPVEIRNGSFQYDYNTVPQGTLGGVPFAIPVTGASPYDYFAFYDKMPTTQWTVNGSSYDTLTLSTGSLRASTAYLLLNTNWGKPDFKVGTVTFNPLSGNNPFSIDLIGDSNIRDWNNWTYSNLLGDPAAAEVFSVASDYYGLPGRIDMLTVQLPEYFMNDPLSSIVFTDFGQEDLSRIRVEGITIDVFPVPEPSTALLLFSGIAAVAVGSKVRRQKSR